MSTRVLIRTLTLFVALPIIGWLVTQIISGFQTINSLNQQVEECVSGVMHCSGAFYSQVEFQASSIHMFQGFFALCALCFAVMVSMVFMGTPKNRPSATAAVA